MSSRFLFNSENFIDKFSQGQRITLQEKPADQLENLALFNLFVQGNIGYSPIKAPFGSVEFADSFSEDQLDEFVKRITRKGLELGLSEIIITSYPYCYDREKSGMLEKVLLHNNFEVLWSDINYHIDVNPANNFVQLIHRGERWKLRKSIKLNYKAGLWLEPNLEQVYQLVYLSRSRKGYELSLSKWEFLNMFKAMPDKYLVFAVWKSEELCAVAVTVTVSEKILYIFYTADQLPFRKLSPVVLLHHCIYKYCIDHQFEILDLGTASKHGQVNEGVANFKKRLSGQVTLKHTFIRHLCL